MARTKTPPVIIDARDYEKFQLLAEQEGTTVAEEVRKLIKAFNQVKLATGRSLVDLAQEMLLKLPKKDNLESYTFNKSKS